MERALKAERGFTMVAVIFLIVVLGSALGFMLRMLAGSVAIRNADLLSARAEQAAWAGIDWGVYQVVENDSCISSTAVSVTAYDEYSITVTCSAQNYSGDISIYQLTAIAEYGTFAEPEYVWRKFEVSVEP